MGISRKNAKKPGQVVRIFRMSKSAPLWQRGWSIIRIDKKPYLLSPKGKLWRMIKNRGTGHRLEGQKL